MNPLIQSKKTTILPALVAVTFTCFALSPQARAVCQQGCDLTNGNTFLGDDALSDDTTGASNTAIGAGALSRNTTGIDNNASGVGALLYNTTGSFNTATGTYALFSNAIGSDNTATGYYALFGNTIGSDNTATGFAALSYNTAGKNNTAVGSEALYSNTTGGSNSASGVGALLFNTTGSFNTATGQTALYKNTTGNKNTAVGQGTLNRNTIGSSNIAIGWSAGGNLTTGDNNIDIFDRGVAGEANTIRIGKAGTQTAAFIAGISGQTATDGVAVYVNIDGKLGTVTSSARFKEQIKPMDKASEVILALNPVRFRYKQEVDPKGTPQFGLVAEEVEKVSPDLIARDRDGMPYTVRYEAVNAMLLNEFLKAHRKAEEQEATITELKKDFRATVAQLTTRLDEQAAQIQKVSTQLEATKPASQVVNNP